MRKRIADKKEEAIQEATSLCKSGGNAIQEIEATVFPLPLDKTIPIIIPTATQPNNSSAQITLLTKPTSTDYGPPSAVIHQPKKSSNNPKTCNANGTATPSSTNEEYVEAQGSTLDCLNYDSSETASGQQRSSIVQYYNGVPSADGLRLRSAANKNDKSRKTERSASVQQTTEIPLPMDSDRSAVSDLERTASLKGITVFKGHVPGENSNYYQTYGSCTEHTNSKCMSSSTPNTRTPTSATACATAVTHDHIIQYGDEHVESYL